MKKIKFILYQLLLTFAACLLVFTQSAAAISPISNFGLASDYLDFTANNIQTYEPRDSLTACGSTGGAVSGFNPDPAAVKYFNDNIKPKLARLTPLYQKAAAEEGMADWQILAGLHHMESGMSTKNSTSNPNYRGIFQQNAGTLSSHGVDPSAPPFDAGRELSDDEIVTQAKAAIKYFIKGKATSTKVDISKPLSVNDAMKVSIAYKSGQGSPWLTGGADPNLHAYTWTGFDTTPQHKMPMIWGNTNDPTPPDDEKPGKTQNRPGALTVWAMLKSGDVGSLTGANCVGATATFQGITGTREELAARVLANSKLKLGNYNPSGNAAATQKTDIQNGLTANILIVLAAAMEQGGVESLPINSLIIDHRDANGNDSGDHPAGRAADIGFFGNGHCQTRCEEGNKLYNFFYTNYQQLKIDQLIWQDPPSGTKCIGQSKPVDCYAFYGNDTMSIHNGHIHVGVLK